MLLLNGRRLIDESKLRGPRKAAGGGGQPTSSACLHRSRCRLAGNGPRRLRGPWGAGLNRTRPCGDALELRAPEKAVRQGGRECSAMPRHHRAVSLPRAGLADECSVEPQECRRGGEGSKGCLCHATQGTHAKRKTLTVDITSTHQNRRQC